MKKVITRKISKISKNPTTIAPKVLKLIAEISKKYSGVWQELAKR